MYLLMVLPVRRRRHGLDSHVLDLSLQDKSWILVMCIPTLRSSTTSHGHVGRLVDFRNRAEMLMETLQAFDRRTAVPFTITLDTVGMSRPGWSCAAGCWYWICAVMGPHWPVEPKAYCASNGLPIPGIGVKNNI